MTTLYLVRHAHSVFSADESRPLSAEGAAAARALADRLAAEPIAAIHASTARRAFDTVAPLAQRLGISITLHHELRERELPPVADHEFKALVRAAWLAPLQPVRDGESNHAAQIRAHNVIAPLVEAHRGQHVVVATHGNLLTLILNRMDSAYDYDFWDRLSLPDVYRVQLDGNALHGVERVWA